MPSEVRMVPQATLAISCFDFAICFVSFANLQAAESSAGAERDQRAAAEALAQQLQAEGARRANVFNAAVRSAVSKIQAQLEAERDELGSRFDLMSDLTCLRDNDTAHDIWWTKRCPAHKIEVPILLMMFYGQ